MVSIGQYCFKWSALNMQIRAPLLSDILRQKYVRDKKRSCIIMSMHEGLQQRKIPARGGLLIGVNDICLRTLMVWARAPPSSKRSCFLMSLFQVPYHISLSLTVLAKGGRRNICTSIWDPGKGSTSNDGTSSMLSVIVSGCPSGLIASRETKTERKKVSKDSL